MNPTTAAEVQDRQRSVHPLRIGELLLERGIVSREQIEQALAFQRNRGHARLLGEVLVELAFVTDEQVLEVLADAYNVPFARLTPAITDPRIREVLPRDFCEKQCVVPMFLVEGKLTLAIHEPANVFLVEEVERLTGYSVQVVAATARDIKATLDAGRSVSDVVVIDEIVGGLDAEDLTLVERQVTELADADAGASDSPIIKLVNHVIYAAVHEGASDIHIEPDDATLRVRYRVDGVLFTKLTPPPRMLPAVVSRIKIMAGMDISERRMPQDGGMSVVVDGRPVDLRVSTMPGKFGEKVVIRVIDKRNASTRLDQLGLSPQMLESWRNLVQQPNGIVLVTGPTGSGKSTTLYASLAEINDDSINISTVEDPVEYHIAGVNQFQVNTRTGFTFASALRSLLRQDPDVVMLGEVRDEETAKIATQAALTGHLVLSTLHTNDAPSAITRLFNIGVESYLVAAAIRGVLAQRLVRKVCRYCRQPREITPQLRSSLDRLGEAGRSIQTLHHGIGCSRCRETGYSGRVGIYELYVPDDECLDAISRGATLQELRGLANRSGRYRTLREDGLEKVREGVTTIDELLTATAV
jgi:type IV pilus assembly protein PilB